ncbi:hypothetical protein GIB67_011083 [Kingdonia uniflora]|uniref:Uncharacterized protein n=1 Tax=Kingdonia uniflora TaxID=39325 RepID=A0A7J7LKQ9_9MAGN|nr:hypothetical protein GIB67_011083 [Kingdonia uniflora]
MIIANREEEGSRLRGAIPKPRELHLVSLPSLEEWVEQDGLASLRILIIRDYYKGNFRSCTLAIRLQSIPYKELKCLTSLKRLTMSGFSKKQISFPFPNYENRGAILVQQHLLALQELELVGWSTLTSLPDGLQCLTTLEKLTISYYPKCLTWKKMPKDMRRFTLLQTLPTFKVGTVKGCGIWELLNLNLLGDALAITELENVENRMNAEKAN